MIYAESRGDFYSRTWTEVQFDAQLQIVEDPEAYVAITDEGFIRLSLIERIVEFVKGLFGGIDAASEERIQAASMKFLYYGEAHDFLTHKHLNRLRSRFSLTDAKSPIRSFVQEMDSFHIYRSEHASKSEYLGRLRGLVTDYHRRHTSALQPGFWSRLMTSPSIDPQNLFDFGDTPLQLMQKALDGQDPKRAFRFLLNAFDLKNDEIEFQEKLAGALEKIEDSYSDELKDHSSKRQQLWIELAQNAFEKDRADLARNYLEKALNADCGNAKGRLEIGRLYLENQEYAEAEPFLQELQKAYAENPQILAQIGHAYWEEGQYPAAVAAYECALSCYQQPTWQRSPIQKEMALLFYKMGEAHLDDLLLPAHPGNQAKARKFLSEAVMRDPTVAEYQEDLCEAYEDQWNSDPDQFTASSLPDFLKFLKFMDPNVLKQRSSKISRQLLECAERLFKAHQNQQAHVCLEEALRISDSQTDLKIDALDLALRYNDPKPLKTKFERWNKENYANPYLKMKIGDAYWDSSKALALAAYEEALDLFAKRVASTKDDKEKKECQKCMGEIHAKIGQDHLQTQPGIFKGVPFEQALKRLEEAAKHNPAHATQLFDAYLAAAQAEKQRNVFRRDTNKMIEYYQKAFETLYKKGEYLIDLLQLCLDSKRNDDAVTLFLEIQKQPWAQDLNLPGDLYSRLSTKLFDRKEYKAAHACLKAAHRKEPKNQQYKKDYFQLTLTLADESYAKLLKKSDQDECIAQLKELSGNLKECWDEGFDGAPTLEYAFQNLLAQIYEGIAKAYLQQCLIPQSEGKYFGKSMIKEHLEKHQAKIAQALKYYNKALEVNPKSASLHFDKGLLLEYWMIDFDAAFKEYELAVKYQPRNPFYHFLLGQLYAVIFSNIEKKNEHFELVEKFGSEDFNADRDTFNAEMRFKEKSKEIDPHSYTKTKGWFD